MRILPFLVVSLALQAACAFASDSPLDRFLSAKNPLLNYQRAGEAKLYHVSLNGSRGRFLWAGDLRSKQVALTFDDGPNPHITPQVLKILEDHKARATFFLIGQNALRYPDLVKQIHASGHALGNHTFSHARLTRTPPETLKTEIERTGEIIKEATGAETALFRPPFGAFDSKGLMEFVTRKFDVVLWSVDSRDWSDSGIPLIKSNVLSAVRGGSIVLCHDGHGPIVQVLPAILQRLGQDGYQCVTIPEMIASTLEAHEARALELPWTPAMWRLP